MASLTLRIDKGSPLTNSELDNNFRQLNLLKVELGGDLGGGTSAPVVTSLRGNAVGAATPTTGQTLTWSGTAWIPVTQTQGVVTSTLTSIVTSVVNSTVTSTVNTTTTTYPTFSAYPNSSIQQTILANGQQQKVLFQNEEWDNANCFANSRFTPTVAGYYQLNATVRMDGSGAQEGMLTIWKNGAEYHRGWNASGTTSGASWFSMQVGALCYANGTSDYFEIYIQNSAGISKDVTVAGQPGFGNITWFNGIYVPTQIITAVSGTALISSAVSSALSTTSIAGLGNVVTVLDDIGNQFNNRQQIFTLKDNRIAITETVNYTDNKDFTVSIGNRSYRPAVPQTSTLGPWIVEYTAERTYTYKVSGSRIIFYRGIETRQSADIRINNKSTARQKRSRYPFSANSIVLGD